MSKSPSLLDVQRTLQRAIVDGDDAPLKDLIAQDPSAIAGAIDIYRNTIRWTLARSLRLCYPAVHRLVGAEFFEGAVEQFLQDYWPESACLNDFGEDLAA
ncbi:MAG TPA: DNA-binding domain-containing protein, partial [Burkholderiaceae bacterium]|nr:DNA-binding domain-containing protein [Burkholderiaceae bacterium]